MKIISNDLLIPSDDARLFTVAREVVATDTPLIVSVLPEMENARGRNRGVALAAPQVGIPLRFFITDRRWLPSVVVNPVIELYSEDTDEQLEGCLSFPGKKIPVRRSRTIHVRYINVLGQKKTSTLTGYPARIFQHEFDQLNGICIFPNPATLNPPAPCSTAS